jgi:hypothetical protein
MFLLLISLILAAVPANTPGSRAERIPTVSLCDVLAERKLYNDKIIRIRAVFTRGGEDWVAIYCPGCSNDQNLLKPGYADSFDRLTDPRVRRRFRYHPDVTLAVTLVGRLPADSNYFKILRAERAHLISKTGSSPWRLPKALKRRNPC